MKLASLFIASFLVLAATVAHAVEWTPEKWTGEETLQFRTECPDEGEYWSYVWVVVLDGDAWVRLGSRAAGRVDCSKTKPLTSIKIAGQQFDGVEMVNTPEMAERVAAAMAEKYSSDLFVHFFNHPYTMKLVPKKTE